MSTDEIKSLRVPEFTGKKQDWEFWENKFLARAGRRHFRKLMLNEKEAKKLAASTAQEKKNSGKSSNVSDSELLRIISQKNQLQELLVVVKADVQGSLT